MKMNKFILGDCMDPEFGLPSYPDNYFDLSIVDPPYGIKDDGRNHLGRVYKKSGDAIKKRDPRNGKLIKVKPQTYKITSKYDDKQPSQDYFNELFRVSKHQIIWGCNYLKFDQKDKSSGRIIWDKVNGNTDQSDCEIAWTSLFSSIRMLSFMWNGMLQGKSLNEGKVSQGNNALKEKRRHPNHKPERLYAWLVHLKQVKKHYKLLDTHVGSASSLEAFSKYNFSYVGYEIDSDYYAAAKNRMMIKGRQKVLL